MTNEEKEMNEIREKEEKIMKELRKKGGQSLKDYETFLSLIKKSDDKDDLIIIGEEENVNHNNESGDNKSSEVRPENSSESLKPKSWGDFKPGCWGIILFFFGPILLLLIAPQIEKSDIFQRTVNTQKYWRMQVATLEEDIYKTQLFIKDCEDSFQKSKRIPINYDSLVRKLIIEGKEPEDAKQIAFDTIKEIDKVEKETDSTMRKLQVREHLLETSYKSLDDYKRQLEQAKKELAKYQ